MILFARVGKCVGYFEPEIVNEDSPEEEVIKEIMKNLNQHGIEAPTEGGIEYYFFSGEVEEEIIRDFNSIPKEDLAKRESIPQIGTIVCPACGYTTTYNGDNLMYGEEVMNRKTEEMYTLTCPECGFPNVE